MNAALDRHLSVGQQVVLLGHSGGGALAVLMAETRNDVIALVTLAGNLDIDAWVKKHDYSALRGSLNPANSRPLNKEIRQFHFLGARDSNITREMIEPVVRRQTGAQLTMLEGLDHTCCWEKEWPNILRKIPR